MNYEKQTPSAEKEVVTRELHGKTLVVGKLEEYATATLRLGSDKYQLEVTAAKSTVDGKEVAGYIISEKPEDIDHAVRRVFARPGETLLVGSDPKTVEDDDRRFVFGERHLGVSRTHCLVYVGPPNGDLIVTDMSRFGTVVEYDKNDVKSKDKTPAPTGWDALQDVETGLSAQSPDAPSQEGVLSMEQQSTEWTLRGEEIDLGRPSHAVFVTLAPEAKESSYEMMITAVSPGTSIHSEAAYIITLPAPDIEGTAPRMVIRPGEAVVFGRNAAAWEGPGVRGVTVGAQYPVVSKNHCAVIVTSEGGLTVKDLGSLNGTGVKKMGEEVPQAIEEPRAEAQAVPGGVTRSPETIAMIELLRQPYVSEATPGQEPERATNEGADKSPEELLNKDALAIAQMSVNLLHDLIYRLSLSPQSPQYIDAGEYLQRVAAEGATRNLAATAEVVQAVRDGLQGQEKVTFAHLAAVVDLVVRRYGQ